MGTFVRFEYDFVFYVKTNHHKEIFHPINNTEHEFYDIFIKIQILCSQPAEAGRSKT